MENVTGTAKQRALSKHESPAFFIFDVVCVRQPQS